MRLSHLRYVNPENRRRQCLYGLLIWVFVGALLPSITGYGQVQMTEVPLVPPTGLILEPGMGAPMVQTSSFSIGDGKEVFQFKIKDVDPLANDSSDVIITFMMIENLGTATDLDIIEVACLDEAGQAIAPVDTPVASFNPNVAFEAVCDPNLAVPPPAPSFGSRVIPDDGEKTFQVAVRVADTSTLLNTSQNHTVRLRVTVEFEESAGSPPLLTTFTNSITDSIPDFVFNGGINRIEENSGGIPASIKTGGEDTVARFRVCDHDANGHDLLLKELTLVQGPLGTAVISDFDSFSLVDLTTNSSLGQISGGSLNSNFNRGGSGIPLVTTASITDPGAGESCKDYAIKAKVALGAMKGRTIHLKIIFTMVEEPSGFPIDPSAAPSLQTSLVIIIGQGVLRVPDMQIAGSEVPIEISAFPQPGLGAQTASIQFDPNVIQIDDVVGQNSYQASTLLKDNRAGLLRFALNVSQMPSAKTDATVASLKISKSKSGQPGQRSILLLQAESITDANGMDITSEVIVVSGSVTLLFPGDIDRDSRPTVRDALWLASAIVTYCLADPPQEIPEDSGSPFALSNEQKSVADVVISDGAPRQTNPNLVPTCDDLDSSDVARIAELAITFEGPSAAALSNKPQRSFLESLLRFLRPSEPLAQVSFTSILDSSRLIVQIDSNGHSVGGLQGRIRFDPQLQQIRSMQGRNDYKLLASKIDNTRGEARFVMLAPPGRGSRERDALQIIFQTKVVDAAPELHIEYLLDPKGQQIPYTLKPQAKATVMPLEIRSVSAYPIDHTLWQLRVVGQGIASVRVEGFDLEGRKRFAAESAGSSLRWMPLDQSGRPLANGVYLYVVIVRGYSGEIWQSTIRKMMVLR